MWTEQWSEKHQRPFFVNAVTLETTWKSPVMTVSQSYDHVASHSRGDSSHDEDDELKQRALGEVRVFHNQVKRHLIAIAIGTHTELSVLDVCCGKGGDLLKWLHNKERLKAIDGFDGSVKCIEEAQKRLAARGDTGGCRVRYFVHDGRKREGWGERPGVYDIISAQFCIHYFFSCFPLAMHFFRSARQAAKTGARLIFTYVNERELAAQLFGHVNSVDYFIPLPETCCSASTCLKEKPPDNKPYPYVFWLDKCVHQLAEFSVPKECLFQVMRQSGWEITLHEPFHEFGRRNAMLVPSLEEGFAISKLYNVCVAVAK